MGEVTTGERLAKALMVAIRVHADQRDKQGEPYLLHVLRVVEAVGSERAKVLAALHDVWENGGASALDPEDLFTVEEGMFIANSLEVLTRSDSETYAEYIEGIRDGHSSTWVAEIREVKLADLRDNLERIPPEPPKLLSNPLSAKTYGEWKADWQPLKARYEKAIAVLTDAGFPSERIHVAGDEPVPDPISQTKRGER